MKIRDLTTAIVTGVFLYYLKAFYEYPEMERQAKIADEVVEVFRELSELETSPGDDVLAKNDEQVEVVLSSYKKIRPKVDMLTFSEFSHIRDFGTALKAEIEIGIEALNELNELDSFVVDPNEFQEKIRHTTKIKERAIQASQTRMILGGLAQNKMEKYRKQAMLGLIFGVLSVIAWLVSIISRIRRFKAKQS